MSNIPGYSSNAVGNSAGTESGKPIKDMSGYGTSKPTPYVPSAGAGGGDTGNTPGTYEISPFDPMGSAGRAYEESDGLLVGLRNTLFGLNSTDGSGHHGGFLGDIPLVGDLGRGASNLVGEVGTNVVGVGKGALDVVGGALEHVDIRTAEEQARTQRLFDLLPEGGGKAEALAAIEKDPGAAGHYMAKAINDYEAQRRAEGDLAGGEKPSFTTGAFREAGSAAEAFDNILAGLGLGARAMERKWTEIGTPGQGGMDRLGIIMAVGRGEVAFNEDKGVLGTGFLQGEQTGGGLNRVEQIVFDKVSSGTWTEDEARDFLAANNSGFSHSAVANIAGNIALDPSNFAGLGAAGIAKVGATGAKLARATKAAEEALDLARDAERAAKASGVADDIAAAAKAVQEAEADLKAVNGALKTGEASVLNPLGQLARSEKATNLVRGIYSAYEPLQAMHVDKAMKVARGIVDPLGGITLHNPFRKQMLDMVTDDATKEVIGAYGAVNHAKLTHKLADATDGMSTPLADMFSEDLGTYSANLTRRVIAREQRRVAVASGNAGKIMKAGINEVVAGIEDHMPKNFKEHIMVEANRFRIHTWDDTAIANLAARMADNYGVKSLEEWTDWLKDGLNADELSMLHAATYGRATKRLLDSVREAQVAMPPGDFKGKLGRLILINRNTLTQQGAAGVVADIKAATTTEAKLDVIRAAQKQYPELRGFTVTAGQEGHSVERFTKELERHMPAFPSQVIDDELAQLPDDLKALHGDNTYTLGFSPEDEYKWGLRRTNDAAGDWAPVYDVWVDHVAPGIAAGYRTPGRLVETNLAGQPILGAVGKSVGRSLDYIDAGVRTMGRRVTGVVIADAARQKFLARAVERYAHAGITDTVAKDMMDALEDAVSMQDIVVRPSGLTTKQMWKAVEDIIPKSVRPADFDKRDLMNLVLDAYQGDLRFVGITQALSSRVKRVLAFESNNASLLAEQVYPNLKYRLNAIFQVQEKIEPYILNSLRGVTPARSVRHMNDADRATQRLMERMAQNSLVSNADHEMQEYANAVNHGKTIEEQAVAANTSLGRMTKTLGVDWAALRDVKGVKQVNMLRTFRKGMGKDLRRAWDATHPGLFDDMYAEAVRKARKGAGGLDEDEFAVSIIAEQMLGNDIVVNRVLGDRVGALARQYDKVDYRAAIAPGTWSAPQTLGELKTLDLDTMAELLAFPVGRAGKLTQTQADLRSAIAAGNLTLDDVAEALTRFNADPDYIARVRSALEFSWTGFWSQVAHDFNLSDKQREVYEDIIANAAALRNMTPIDYISQVLRPQIGLGSDEPLMGHLGSIKDILDSQGNVLGHTSDLAGLSVQVAGEGTEDQFVRQLAKVMTQHLDPSAKVGLIRAFQPELLRQYEEAYDINMETVNRLWTPEMQQMFEDHVLGSVHATDDIEAAYEAGMLRTLEDFDRFDPGVEQQLIRSDGATIPGPKQRFIGDGVRNAPPEVQRDVLQTVGRMMAEHPDMPLKHVDIVPAEQFDMFLEIGEDPFGVAGVAVESSLGGDAIILNARYYGSHPDKSYAEIWDAVRGNNNMDKAATEFPHDTLLGTTWQPRESTVGAGFSALDRGRDTVAHELGHVIHSGYVRRYNALVKAGKGRTKEARMLKGYVKYVEEAQASLGGRRLSEYARKNGDEFAAELHSLAFMSKSDDEVRRIAQGIDAETAAGAADMLANAKPVTAKIATEDEYLAFVDWLDRNAPHIDVEEIDNMASEWLGAVEDGDVEGAAEALADLNILTKRAEKEAKEALKDVPQPEGLDPKRLAAGPQTVEDMVMGLRERMKANGLWKPAPVRPPTVAADNPDVIRAVQYFGRWSEAVMGQHIRRGGNAVHAATMDKIAGIPTHAGVAYNETEQLLMASALDSMQSKWDDAHRLQYYARGRTMLERSINHPMFGIYPASYMWGKMLPEMMRFVAKEPFGVRTGAAAYTIMDAQKNVAIQRELDPEFDKQIENLGHSSAFFALGYLLPSWPWESSAAWPGWVREFGKQGLDMEARVESGGTVATDASSQGINVPQALGKATDTMNPLKALDRTVFEPLEEINPGKPKEGLDESNPYVAHDTVGRTQGGDLTDPLTDVMSQLTGLFGG